MEYQQGKQEINTCEQKKSDLSSTSVISCLDDNSNYTYAKSCKGGNYLFYLF